MEGRQIDRCDIQPVTNVAGLVVRGQIGFAGKPLANNQQKLDSAA